MSNMYLNFPYFLILISTLFIQLLPIFFITGPAIPDIVISSISIIFLFIIFYKKKFYLFTNYIIYFLLIIFVYLNFNSFFSENSQASFKYSIGFLRVIIFTVALFCILQKNTNLIKNFAYCFLVCVIFLFLDSLLQFFTGRNILGYEPQTKSRMTSFFLDEQIMGSYISRLLALTIGLFYVFNKNKLLIFFLILISGVTVFLSGERTSLAYFLIILFCYFLIELNIRSIIIMISLLFLSLSFIVFNNHAQFDRIVTHTIKQSKESKYGLYSYRHQLHYLTANSMFLDSPLLGQGLGSFRHLCGEEKFNQSQKIIKDGSKYAKISGYFFYEKIFNPTYNFSYINIYVVDKKEKLKAMKQDVKISKISPYAYTSDTNNIFYFKQGDYVAKNELLYSYFEYKNGCNTHPHNIYMQFLAELGILGFGLFSAIFLYVAYRMTSLIRLIVFKKYSNNLYKAQFFVLLAVFVGMFPLLPSGNYFGNWLLLISYLPFGFYLYIKEINVPKPGINI